MVSDSKTHGMRKPSDGSGSAAAPVPQRLGKYVIKKTLGSGGMGTVFLAVDTQLRRTVALKVLPREKADNPTLVRRFHSEAQAAAQLKHENIVTVYEAGELDGHLYMALEYVEGTDVHKLVSARGVIPVKRSVDIIKQVARALKHAHERNIVHRDIKPSNLLIQRDGTVKLADMGLARLVDETEESGITRAGTTVGTVDYIAPEQARDSKAADIRSDIYSLGCTWYHMLTGEPPFPGGSMTNKLYGHMAKERPDPRKKNDAVPGSVVAVMHRMMAKSKKQRYQTPAELLEDLERLDLSRNDSPRDYSERLYAAIVDDEPGTAIGEETAAEQATSHAPAQGRQRRRARRRPKQSASAAGSAADSADTLTRSSSGSASEPGQRRTAAGPPQKASSAPVWTYLAVGVLGCLFVGLLWWVATQIAAALDSPGAVITRPGVSDETEAVEKPIDAKVTTTTVDPGDSESDGSKGGDSPEPTVRPSDRPTRRSPGNHGESVFVQTGAGEAVGSITIGREGEKKYLPAWVADLPEPAAPLPNDLPVLTVGRGPTPPQFADIDSALASAAASGAVIQLQGEGPFQIGPRVLDGGRTIVITGKPGSRPVVYFEPDHGDPSRPVLRLHRGRLVLLGVHLVVAAERFATEKPVTVIEVGGGELAVRKCSATLLGRRSAPTVFVRLSELRADSHQQNRLLFDRTFVRGDWTTVELDCRACDLVFWNSLFALGNAPLLRTLPQPTPEEPEGQARRPSTAPKEGERRLIRLLSSTVSAMRTAFQFVAAGEAALPPPTAVLTLNCLLAAPSQSAGNADLAVIRRWPYSRTPIAHESQFHGLDWSVRHSVFLGWSALVRQDRPDDPIQARGEAAWQRVWQASPAASEFARLAWPTVSAPFADPERLSVETFDPATVTVSGTATDGGSPGCQIGDLTLPANDLIGRVRALAHRPVPPAPVVNRGSAPRVVQVDLNREDLGRVVSSPDWTSGTVFIATGSGPQTSSPIRVKGKSLRIEFRQAEGRELELSARPIDPQDIAEEGDFSDAFIAIRGGTIEIVGGNLKIPRTTTRPFPRWFLYAEDANFVLQDCLVSGALAPASRNKGLIRWSTTGQTASTPAYAGRYAHHALIRNSFLSAYGTVVQMIGIDQALEVDNSVLAGVRDVLEIDIGHEGKQIRGAVALNRCTLSAGHRFFALRAIRRAEPPVEPFRFFVTQTVFAPPVESTPPGGAILLAVSDEAAIKGHQLQWWGYANGYSRTIGSYLSGASIGAGSFDSAWLKTWAPAACLFPIADRGDVALKRKYPPVTRLTVSDFELHPASKAARWSDLQRPIGADTSSILAARPQAAASRKTPRTNGQKPPKRGTPKF